MTDYTSTSTPPNDFPGMTVVNNGGTQTITIVGPSGEFNAVPMGFEQITELSPAASLTVPEGAKYFVAQSETQDVRWRDDGDAPTATVGMLLPAGEELYYDGDLSAIKFIEEVAGAVLNISYFA